MEHFDNQHLEYDQTSDDVKAYTNEIMLTMRDMLKLNTLYKVLTRRHPHLAPYRTGNIGQIGTSLAIVSYNY